MQETYWKRCLRMLMVNTLSDLEDLQRCVDKILVALISNPADEKYASLSSNSSYLPQNLFNKNGGIDILMGVGFECSTEQNESQNMETSRRLCAKP